nr:MFS transporter [uncultured Holophaga sp.]
MSEHPHDPFQSLRYAEYRWFLVGTTAVFMATQIQTAVMGWQVYGITHDPLSLGLVGLSEAIPFLCLTLIGGYAADRRDRRGLALIATAVLALCACLLLVYNLHHTPSALPFYGIQFLTGIGRAFYRPTSQALGTELVPREAYHNAATWRSSLSHTAMVVGPALGGLLYGFGNATTAYSTELGLMLVGFIFLMKVGPRPRPAPRSSGLFQSLTEGLRFVFREKLILGALSLDLFAVLFGGAVALLPVFASDILHTGPQGFGILRATPAVGSVLMSLVLAFMPPMRKAGRTLLIFVAAFGLCWIAFAFSRWFGLSLGLLLLSGAFDNVSVVLRATLVQSYTPQEMMGRVSAVNAFFIGSSNELGAFESGITARLMGLIPAVVFGGCMTLVVVAATAGLVPQLRRLDRMDGRQD